MLKRVALITFFFSLFLCIEASANAQGTFEFLGSPRPVTDKFSPRFGIRYNTQGYDQPQANWTKKIAKMQKKGVPDSVINQILAYPGSADAIGEWVDEAFESVRNEFSACGGTLAQRAGTISPRAVSITIMPSAFYEPYWNVYVAGVFYPTTREIKVLNIYYHWSGPNTGWLRHAKDLLKWEMGNYFAVESRIQPEPRPAGWPCTAPPLK
ncbi:MAG TPA: hypothetical protein VNN73_21295 [Blastocatellia bacterium]|nr:hypothetical protein [Blastocatellia bacterium]